MVTKKQQQVLEFIGKYQKKNKYSPSLEEIQKKFKLASVSTAHYYIQQLKNKGYLSKEESQHRSINVLTNKTIKIPVLGNIAAGSPIEAIETQNETISLSQEEIPGFGKHYALRVQGDSMIEDGIFDGDIVVIKEQQTADDGQTVVAIIDDNQATLKRIYKESNRIRLQPANQSLLPIFRKEVEIRGIVVKIIRYFENTAEDDSPLMNLVKKMPFTINSHRIATSSIDEKPKPFLQWVGGKREMIPQYEHLIPKKFNRYFEPFLGGGAMFFYLQPKEAILSDNNKELIKTYEGVRDNPDEVVKFLKELKQRHSEETFNKVRNLDREINIFEELTNSEIAARMIYLNQTCFNGLYRVNQKSQFNVPIGSSLNRAICDEYAIKNASKILQSVTLKDTDFEDIVKDAKRGDFVYLDPPYYPLSVNSDFTRYTKEKFYQEDQVRLKKQIDKLTKKGCKVMISNSDCDFIKDLYKDYKIHTVYSGRNLNCKKDQRGKVSELVIINY